MSRAQGFGFGVKGFGVKGLRLAMQDGGSRQESPKVIQGYVGL